MLKFFKFILYAVLSVCVLAFFFAAAKEEPVFEEGVSYTFYTGESSSNAKAVTVNKNPALAKILLFDIKGESAVYADKTCRYFLDKFSAEILFVCECGDTVNYYCYSKDISGGIYIDGVKVNLHIAESGESGCVCVGTPLIFGGY